MRGERTNKRAYTTIRIMIISAVLVLQYIHARANRSYRETTCNIVTALVSVVGSYSRKRVYTYLQSDGFIASFF